MCSSLSFVTVATTFSDTPTFPIIASLPSLSDCDLPFNMTKLKPSQKSRSLLPPLGLCKHFDCLIVWNKVSFFISFFWDYLAV